LEARLSPNLFIFSLKGIAKWPKNITQEKSIEKNNTKNKVCTYRGCGVCGKASIGVCLNHFYSETFSEGQVTPFSRYFFSCIFVMWLWYVLVFVFNCFYLFFGLKRCLFDYFDFRAKRKRIQYGGRTESEMLGEVLEKLLRDDPTAFINLEKEQDGSLQLLFIQTSELRENVRKYPQVVMFDHTYKINMNRMPISSNGNGRTWHRTDSRLLLRGERGEVYYSKRVEGVLDIHRGGYSKKK